MRGIWDRGLGMTMLLILGLAACTPQSQNYNPPEIGHAKLADGIYRTVDDTALPYRKWLPQGKPKAIIVAVHGFNDYSYAFEYPGEFFRAHGVAMYAYDQRGFGATKDIGIWAGEGNLTHDLKQFVELVKLKHPRVPVYVLGESMGGAVAINALAGSDFPKVRGLILSAPAVWGAENMSFVYRGTLWLAAHTIPSHEFTGSDLKILASNNYPMLVRMVHDPLIVKKARVDAVYGLVQLMGDAYENIPAIKTPTLLLYGAEDQVIPSRPIERAIARFTVPVEYAYYPDGYHMLLRDLEREEIYGDILHWIDHPAAKLPSGDGKTHDPADQAPALESPNNK